MSGLGCPASSRLRTLLRPFRSTCTTASCTQALRSSRFDTNWDAEDICRSAGCLYRAAQTETLVLAVDEVTTARYAAATLRPVLRIEPRCAAGLTTPFYWKDGTFCETSRESNNDIMLPQEPDDASRFSIQFNIQRPGLYTLKLSLAAADGTTWNGPPVDVDVQPGLPSTETTTISYQSSSETSTPVSGSTFNFELQLLDLNQNRRFGIDDVFAEVRLASLEEMNHLSAKVQPSGPVLHQIATPRLAVERFVDSAVALAPDVGDEQRRGMYSFNITLDGQGVYALRVWICPGTDFELCNSSAAPIAAATPLTFTVCQSNALIADFADSTGVVTGARLHECQCDSGYYGDVPNGCTACERGSYTSTIGSEVCLPCDAGTSCDCNSITSKTPCTESRIEAACSQCLPCGPGYYQDLEGQAVCKQCPDGFHCAFDGMTFPIANKGYWISSDGLLSKHDCAKAGHMPDAWPGGDSSLV
eukprot:COSAG04_NODE_5727_length_1510_cov_1.201984_1_plen_473_part_01